MAEIIIRNLRKEFGDFIASEIKKWTTVVDAAHLRQK